MRSDRSVAASRKAAKKGLSKIVVQRRHTTPGAHPFDGVTWMKRTARISGDGGAEVFKQEDVEVPSFWSQMATDVAVSKYFRGTLGTPNRETSVKQLISRVADTISLWAFRHGYVDAENQEIFRLELTHILLHQRAAFNSPVWFNVGVEAHPQSSACFINSVGDSMGAILDLAKTEGMLFKHGSGTGSNFSTLRGSKELLRGGGTASGPVSFMKGFDSFAGVIKSGGKTRRAAKMVILDVDHPDIVEFIRCKAEEERKAWALIDAGYDGNFNVPGGAYDSIQFQNANHSVRVSDLFMGQVEDAAGQWPLKARLDGKVVDVVHARTLWTEIAEAAWVCGDPGVQFDTTINDWHTCPNTARINASNPCLRGDTLVHTRTGHVPIRALVGKSTEIWNGAAWQRIDNFRVTGRNQEVLRIKLGSGSELHVTPKHSMILDDETRVEAGALRPGQRLLHSAVMERMSARETEVISIEPGGVEAEVYCCTVEGSHSFALSCGVQIGQCSEFMFLDDTACNLASINLMKYRGEEDGRFDVEAFEHDVDILILAMEVLVGASSYPTEAITRNSYAYRPLGLGYANLGAYLMSIGLAYDSDAGRDFAASVTALLTGRAYRQSAKIAADVGAFDGFATNRDAFLRVMRKHEKAIEVTSANHITTAAARAWSEAIALGERYGFRNAQASVLAPTGTIAFLMDCDTTGIEPDIALVKTKKLVGGGSMRIVNQTLPLALKYLCYSDAEIKEIVAHVDANGSVEGSKIKPEHLDVFDCAFPAKVGGRSIHYMGHLRMMAATQPFISGAISKTVNMPNSATADEIAHTYFKAWKMGLKAVAIYRDGCKRTQPLTTKAHEKPVVATIVEHKPFRRKLPDERKAVTHKFSIAGHEGYVIAGLYDDGSLGEIFIVMSKIGSTVQGVMDAFATSISIALQYGVPLRDLVEKFSHVRYEPAGITNNKRIPFAKSITDYIVRWLGDKFLGDDEAPVVETTTALVGPLQVDAPACSTCGQIMVRNGACYRCVNCGSTSGCS